MINVQSTFAGRELLLTGGGGFLGKVILGMLLDRYPDIRRLHVLLRPSRGRSAEQRFAEDVLGSPALKPLVEARGRAFFDERIQVWEGDAAEPLCGLDPGRLPGVALVIHCAGLVEFFPPVDEALRANVDATVNAADLAEALGAKLTHISTCYVAGRADGLIEEDEPIKGFYPRRTGDHDHAFDAARELAILRERVAEITAASDGRGRRTIEQLTELGRERAGRWGWVNTYTYSKSLAEQTLAARKGPPTAIVRPAIVESARRFPFPGWVEGGRTAAPLVLMALSGMRDWPARPDLALEIVPVDLIAAGILIVSALLLEGAAEPVYHLASADVNPYPMEPLLALLADEARRRNPSGFRGAPRLLNGPAYERATASAKKRAETLEQLFLTWGRRLKGAGLPGADALRARSAEMRKLGLQAAFRDDVIAQYLPFVLENAYVFEAANIRAAVERLAPADRERLAWDPETIDWPSYWREQQIAGVLQWVQPETVREWSFQI